MSVNLIKVRSCFINRLNDNAADYPPINGLESEHMKASRMLCDYCLALSRERYDKAVTILSGVTEYTAMWPWLIASAFFLLISGSVAWFFIFCLVALIAFFANAVCVRVMDDFTEEAEGLEINHRLWFDLWKNGKL